MQIKHRWQYIYRQIYSMQIYTNRQIDGMDIDIFLHFRYDNAQKNIDNPMFAYRRKCLMIIDKLSKQRML